MEAVIFSSLVCRSAVVCSLSISVARAAVYSADVKRAHSWNGVAAGLCLQEARKISSNSGLRAVEGWRVGRFSPELGVRLMKQRVRGRWSDADLPLRKVVDSSSSADLAAVWSVRLSE